MGGLQHKSPLFNGGVGVGKATFNALYSSLLHLDFIPAFPSTSSERHVSLAASGCHLKDTFWQVCLGGGSANAP